MKDIFVNLKRFDVPRNLGGVCPLDNPVTWIEEVIEETIKLNLGTRDDIRLTYFLPEALIAPALLKLEKLSVQTNKLNLGSQGVFRENIQVGGNFGAFTTNLPAASAKVLGCTWSIIGHSEERKDKLGIIEAYDPKVGSEPTKAIQARTAVDSLINQEVLRALESGLNVVFCVGETAQERGEGEFSEQQPRIKAALKNQLVQGLQGVKEHLQAQEVVIAYEPIWAIGPGKTPPNKEYIEFVAKLVKEIVKAELALDLKVVYGGGLKSDNAAMLGSITEVDGGLVALTKFTGEIGFNPGDLKEIVEEYVKGDDNEKN